MLAMENHPLIYPGPQQYWKTLPYRPNKKKKGDDEERATGDEDDDKKKYFMNHEKTDKRTVKPMRKTVY